MDIEQIVKSTLSSDAFWAVNKSVARHVGIEEAALLTEIISKHRYWKERGGLDDQGGFFMTSADIQAVMGIGDKPVGRLTKSILTKGVVKIKKRGVPAKNYWYPQWPIIFSMIGSDPQTGVTGEPVTGVTSDHQTGVAITKNTKPKKIVNKDTDIQSEINSFLKQIQDSTGMILYGDYRLRNIIKKALASEGKEYLSDVLGNYLKDDFMKAKRAWSFTSFFSSKEKMERHKSRKVEQQTTARTLPEYGKGEIWYAESR